MTGGLARRGIPAREIYANMPDFGVGLITPERFTSPEYMQREWDQMWSRTWLCGPHLSELADKGDYVVEEIGRQSLIFVKGADGEVRGFHNVCPHRGNQLITGCDQGTTAGLYCRYHGWRFALDGRCRTIPDLEEFPQLTEEAIDDATRLSEVRTEQWNGFVWYNLDPDCKPLADHLGPLAAHIAPYGMDRQRLLGFVTFEWPCNWKIAADAFNEAYHFAAQHPEMVRYGDDMPEFEFLGDHSVMKLEYGTVSQKLKDRATLNPHIREWMKTYYGMDETTYSGEAKDVAAEHRRRIRAGEAAGRADYAALEDRQITEDWAYMVFPHVSWNVLAEGGGGYRYRPHPTDPNRCFYDLYLYGFVDEDAPPPRVVRRKLESAADLADGLPVLPPLAATAIAQDMSSVGFVQNGMHSMGFRGLILGNQEHRLRHFYHVLDRALASAAER